MYLFTLAAVECLRDRRCAFYCTSSSCDLIIVCHYLASVMSSAMTHEDCGVYTFVFDSGNEQVVVMGLIGEAVKVNRTPTMIDAGDLYKIAFKDSGWGYLVPCNGGPEVKLSSLVFILKKTTCDNSWKKFRPELCNYNCGVGRWVFD